VIYYNSMNDSTVYSYDLTTNENKQIAATACYYLVTYNEAIYCSDYDNAGYLTKVKVEDGSKEVLFEDEVLNLHIQDGSLYFETLDGSMHQQNL